MKKKILIAIAILLALILGLVLAVLLIPLDSYRSLIEEKASASIGRKVAIKGPLSLTFFPMPGVSVEGIEIDNVAGAKDAKFATVKQVKAFVALWPLFKKKVEVSSISIKEPRLFLEKLGDGTNNWTFKLDTSSDSASSVQVFVESIDVSDAYFSYRSGSALYATVVDTASVKLPNLAQLSSNSIPIDFKAQLDRTTIATTFDFDRKSNSFAGKADVDFDPNLLKKFKPDLQVPALLNEIIKIQSDFSASSDAAELKNFVVEVRGQKLSGDITTSFKDELALKGTVNGFPGQSRIVFDVKNQAGQGMLGSTNVNVGDLVALLKWVDIASDKIPAKMTKNIVAKTEFVVNDVTQLRNLDLAVGQAHLQGNLSYQAVSDGHKLVFDLNTPSADQLISLIPRQLSSKIGAASLSGSATGDAKHLQFSLVPSFASSTIRLDGDAYLLGENMRFDVGANIKTSQLSSLLKIAGASLPGSFENASVNGRLKGNADAVDVDLKTQLEDLALGVKGAITGLSKTPTFDLNIDASNPSLRSLMGRLGYPTKVPEGRLSTSMRLQGNKKSINATNLRLSVGSSLNATGSLAINREGAKPSVKANITTNALDMESLFPSAPASARSGSPWSSDPIDLTALQTMTADIDIKAPSIKRKEIVISDPHLVVSIKDGVLNVAPLSGNIFGGALNANATLSSTGAATLKSELKNANVRNLVPKGSNVKIVRGRVSLTTDLATQGKSTREMVSALRGKVDFSSTDGTINGFNLKAISQQIGSFKDWTSVFGLLRTSLNGGQTEFKAFNSEINFNKGVGDIRSMNLSADAAEINAKGAIDLPNYSLDARAELRLTDHKDFPPIGMRLKGPIDSPTRELDTSALQAYLVKNVFTNILDNVVSGRVNEAKNPADLLDKLFGKKPPAAPPPPK